MFERFAPRSPLVQVVRAAGDEARRRGDRRVGTECLLLGLLHDPDSPPARALGIDLETARAALAHLDRAALDALGLHVDAPDTGIRPGRRLAPWTSGARAALGRAVGPTTARTRNTAPSHLLLALLDAAPPDPAAALVAELGIDRQAVRTRLQT